MSDKKKVYALCNSGGGTAWQTWIAVTEDGQIVTSHVSSSRGWGINDVSPGWKREAYEKIFGEGFSVEDIEYIVVDEGQKPPQRVVDAYMARHVKEE